MNYKYFLLALLLTLLSVVSFSQGNTCKQDLFPVQAKNKLYGYQNLNRDWIIVPFYQTAQRFWGNTAIVQLSGKYGVIDCDGKVVFSPQFEKIEPFIAGVAWAKKSGLWGLINDKSEVLHDFTIEEIKDISRFIPFAWVKVKGKWGVFNKDEISYSHPAEFLDYQLINQEYSLVRLGKYKGIIKHDTEGYAYKPELRKVIKVSPTTMVVRKMDSKWGLIADDGKLLLPLEYDSIYHLSKYRLVAEKNNKKACLGHDGKPLTEFIYDEIYPFEHGIARVKKNGKYGFINFQGKEGIEAVYNQASDFYLYRSIVKTDSGAFLISSSRKKVSGLYDDLIVNKPARVYAGKVSDNWVLINRDGNLLSNDSIKKLFTDDKPPFIRVKTKSGNIRFFDTRINQLVFDEHSKASSFKNGFSVIENELGKKGLINSKGEVVVKAVYSSINSDKLYNKPIFKVYDDVCALKDTLGKIIFTSVYNDLTILGSNRIITEQEGEFGLVDYKGRLIRENDLKRIYSSHFPLIVGFKKSVNLMNNKGELLVSKGYESIDSLTSNKFVFTQKGKKGVLNNKGEVILAAAYDDVSSFSSNLYLVEQAGKWGFVNTKSVVRIPMDYEMALPFCGELVVVKKEGKYIVLNKRAERVFTNSFVSFEQKEGQISLFEEGEDKYLLLSEKGYAWLYKD